MAKTKYVNVDIYKTGVRVFVGSHKEFIRYLKKEGEKKNYDDYKELAEVAENRDETGAASFYWHRLSRTLMLEVPSISYNPERMGEVAHEVAHAVFYILDECHVYIGRDDPSKEAFTYTLELIIRGIYTKSGYEVV